MTRLELPWPPTINTYRQPVRMGNITRLVTSNKGKQYKKLVEQALITQEYPLFKNKIGMEIKLHPPDKRKRDIDNYFKPVFDSLVKCNVLEDDELIKEITVYMCDPVKFGQVVVNIKELK